MPRLQPARQRPRHTAHRQGILDKWGGRSTSELLAYLRRQMSTNVPRSAGVDLYLGLIAHILRANGVAAGEATLTADSGLLAGGGTAGPVSAAGEPERRWEGAGGIAEAAASAGQ